MDFIWIYHYHGFLSVVLCDRGNLDTTRLGPECYVKHIVKTKGIDTHQDSAPDMWLPKVDLCQIFQKMSQKNTAESEKWEKCGHPLCGRKNLEESSRYTKQNKTARHKLGNVVHAVPCTEECSDLYIGETKQPLYRHMAQPPRVISSR